MSIFNPRKLAIQLAQYCEQADRCPLSLRWIGIALMAIGGWASLILLGVELQVQ